MYLQIIGNILKAISSIQTFTAENVEAEFPESFQDVAIANLARMDQEVEVAEVPDETPPTSDGSSLTGTSRKRKRDSTVSRRSSARQQPDVNDPTSLPRSPATDSDTMVSLWVNGSLFAFAH